MRKLSSLMVLALATGVGSCSLATEFKSECVKTANCDSPLVCSRGYCVNPTVESFYSEDCTRVYGAPVEKVLSGEAILIADAIARTGDVGPQGPGSERGITLALNEINQIGGIRDAKAVSVLACDTATSQEVTTRVMEHLAELRIPAVIGPASSFETVAAIPIARDNNIFLLSPSATSPGLSLAADDGLFWRTAADDYFQGKAIARHILNHYEGNENRLPPFYRKVAIVNLNDAYGTGLRDAIVKELASKINMDPNLLIYSYSEASIGTATGDQAKAAQAIVADGHVDAVVLISFVSDGRAFMKMVYDAAAHANPPVPVPSFLLTDGTFTSDTAVYTDASGKSAVLDSSVLCNSLGTVTGANPNDPEYLQFVLRHGALYQDEVISSYASQAYDAVYLVALAVAGAGDTPLTGKVIAQNMTRLSSGAKVVGSSMAQLKEAMRTLAANSTATVDYYGASGPLDFDADGNIMTSSVNGWAFNVNPNEYPTTKIIGQIVTGSGGDNDYVNLLEGLTNPGVGSTCGN